MKELPPQRNSQRFSSKKILVVEDFALLRFLLYRVLEEMGHDIYQASDGQEGWEMAQKLRPDVIITDIRMPRMSGLELLEHIRKDETLKAVEVIMWTSETDPAKVEKAHALNAKDYILKSDTERIEDLRERMMKNL